MNRAARSALLVVATVAAAACTFVAPTPATPGSPAVSATPAVDPAARVEASAREAGFELRIRADRAAYAAREPIRVEAALAPVGRGRTVEVSGSSTLVTFGLEQLDGDRRMEPVSTADCARRELAGDAPLVVPFTKSGSPSSDPANEAFWNDYFRDPELRLPAGTWRINAVASFTVGSDCTGRPVSLVAPLDVVVEP